MLPVFSLRRPGTVEKKTAPPLLSTSSPPYARHARSLTDDTMGNDERPAFSAGMPDVSLHIPAAPE